MRRSRLSDIDFETLDLKKAVLARVKKMRHEAESQLWGVLKTLDEQLSVHDEQDGVRTVIENCLDELTIPRTVRPSRVMSE